MSNPSSFLPFVYLCILGLVECDETEEEELGELPSFKFRDSFSLLYLFYFETLRLGFHRLCRNLVSAECRIVIVIVFKGN